MVACLINQLAWQVKIMKIGGTAIVEEIQITKFIDLKDHIEVDTN